MRYPKPMSEKSIARAYAEAGLTEEQIAFVHTFFWACANLYGVLFAREAWDIYRELSAKTKMVSLRRRDLYTALGILRRENLPFYVFELDEVYSEDVRQDKMRIIVHRDLVSYGHGKFFDLYTVADLSMDKPLYIPENLLSYTVPQETPQEKALLRILNGLKSTRSQYTTRYGLTRPCPYTGKYLREFSYISDYDGYELEELSGKVEGHKGNPKRAAELEAKLNSLTAAQYLVNKLKLENSIGYVNPSAQLDHFFDDLNAMGVTLSGEKQLQALLDAIAEMCNYQHLWCNHGWTPHALSRYLRGNEKRPIGFGSGVQ